VQSTATAKEPTMPTRTTTPAGAPCWIDLTTSDVAASTAFYGELFGWTSEEAGPEFGNYVNFSTDGALIAGGIANDPSQGAPDTWTVYLAVDDAAATAEAAEAQGGTVVVPPMPVGDLGVMLVVTDPGGAAIGAWQAGGHKGFQVVDEAGTPAWFELHTREHAAALSFFEKVFGWDAHLQSDTDDFRYATLGEGDEQAAGVMDASPYLPEGVPSFWTVYFRSRDVDATAAKAVSLGATVVDEAVDTPYGRLAGLKDVTGAYFKLVG
jgi:hypothetical protein